MSTHQPARRRIRSRARSAIAVAFVIAMAPSIAQALTVNSFVVPPACGIAQGNGVRGAAIHPDGTIYLPCVEGMLKIVYNPPAAPVQTFINRVGGVDVLATDAAFDANGRLWLAGGNRLLRIDPGADTAQSFPLSAAQGLATRLLIGADNQVWYLNNGTAPFGRFNPANGVITMLRSPSGAKLTDFALAPDGHVWYGSYDYTVGEVLPDNTIRETIVPSPNYIPSLAFDGAGRLWGSASGDAARWVDDHWQRAPSPVPPIASYAYGLMRAPDGVVWQYGFVRSPSDDATLQQWMFGTVAADGSQTMTGLATAGSGGVVTWAGFRPNDGSIFFFDGNSTVKTWGLIQPFLRTPANTTVTEFYNTTLNHYFITANAEEAAGIDSGTAGPGWRRTGTTFKAWLGGPIPAAAEVCRFYGTPGTGPNSHFYTTISEECVAVKRDPGWTYEALGRFWLVRATSSTAAGCPAATQPIYRAYNHRFAFNDSNHRYATDVAVYNQMVTLGWSGEGVVMCAPL